MVFKIARIYAPAVLVLDDLDSLCPLENEELGQANRQSARIAENLSGYVSCQFYNLTKFTC